MKEYLKSLGISILVTAILALFSVTILALVLLIDWLFKPYGVEVGITLTMLLITSGFVHAIRISD